MILSHTKNLNRIALFIKWPATLCLIGIVIGCSGMQRSNRAENVEGAVRTAPLQDFDKLSQKERAQKKIVETTYQTALQLFKQKKYKEAAPRFEQVIQNSVGYALNVELLNKSYYYLGASWFELGQWDSAKKLLTQCLTSSDFQAPKALYLLGQTYLALGQHEEALAASLELMPNNEIDNHDQSNPETTPKIGQWLKRKNESPVGLVTDQIKGCLLQSEALVKLGRLDEAQSAMKKGLLLLEDAPHFGLGDDKISNLNATFATKNIDIQGLTCQWNFKNSKEEALVAIKEYYSCLQPTKHLLCIVQNSKSGEDFNHAKSSFAHWLHWPRTIEVETDDKEAQIMADELSQAIDKYIEDFNYIEECLIHGAASAKTIDTKKRIE